MFRKIKLIVLLFFIPFITFPAGVDYPYEINIEGKLQHWTWANTQNKLALVIQNADQQVLRIIEAETMHLSAAVQIPEHLSIRNMEWAADDSGIIFLSDRSIENIEGLTFFDFKTISFKNNYDFNYIEFSSTEQRWSLYYDPQSRCWATLSTGEGHPDITVSRNGTEIMKTNIYPGYISIIGWQSGRLFLETSLPLKLITARNDIYYLENELRDSNEDISNLGDFIYSFDFGAGILNRVDYVFLPDFRNTSKIESQFYFQYEFIESEYKTIIRMW